jgi:hypothetical protein
MVKHDVKVKVAYTGHDDYHKEFPPHETIGEIKRKALKHFGIEESSADKYVLQFDGANLPDHVKIGELDRSEVVLVLLLKKPQEKGDDR